MANNMQEAKGKVQDAANKTADAAKDMTSELTDKARDVAHDLTDAARSAGRAATRTADSAVASAGQGLESLGDRVRDYGPNKGVFGQATETVASSLHQGGEYLENKGITGMANDVTELIKKNPIPALLLGIGVGFVLARLTSSRS